MAPASCSLDEADLRVQLDRYREVGRGALWLESSPRRQVVQVADDVPDSLIDELIEVEQDCCPFFELGWESAARRLSISVGEREREPALGALAEALGRDAASADA
jgi:hypothetical protein